MMSLKGYVAPFAVLFAAAVTGAACGNSGSKDGFQDPNAEDGGPGSDAPNFGGGSTTELQSITIEPPTATIESVDSAQVTQAFKAVGHFKDGSSGPLTGLSWFASAPQVGAIDNAGLYTANGSVGGVVTIGVTTHGQKANASLTVKLHLHDNVPNVPPNVQSALGGATVQDAAVVWAYPYDGTVWPRGLLAPLLMWNGGAASDFYFVHVQAPTFELESFVTAQSAPQSRVPLAATTWQKLVDSISGAAQITVARWDGTKSTRLVQHTWTIAPASMRGTIYYWSNDLGRVLRIKPGAAKADDFANAPPLNDTSQYPASSCLMTCHTVSADGSTIISGGGSFGGSYSLLTGKPLYSLGGVWGGATNDSSVVRWSNAAISPTGKYILTNAMAEGLARANKPPLSGFLGLYTTADGKPVPTSGLMGVPVTQPAWSPDGTRVAFVDPGDDAPWAGSWNVPPPGDLKVFQFDETKNPMVSAPTTLVASGADAAKRIAWPTMSPDGNWIVYSRAAGADTRSGNADLYFTSAVTPNQETRLAKLDGDGYPFAAGARDPGWNHEPSFAPVAAGGYFWVVFTSRRSYGNVLTGPAENILDPKDGHVITMGTKQLWVAAFDQNPQPGKDPSHPPFHLTGQIETNLAMRGYWALDPCKGDGQGCASGTECCGGFCNGSGSDGGLVCESKSQGCSGDGDKCATTSDCCNAPQGATCINHVCSEGTPK
jgi:hypothetical protein